MIHIFDYTDLTLTHRHRAVRISILTNDADVTIAAPTTGWTVPTIDAMLNTLDTCDGANVFVDDDFIATTEY